MLRIDNRLSRLLPGGRHRIILPSDVVTGCRLHGRQYFGESSTYDRKPAVKGGHSFKLVAATVTQKMGQAVTFSIRRGDREGSETIAIHHGVIAGWTGRDTAAVERHIKELEAIGVKRPATVPIFYRVSATRFTTADVIEVPGGDSSGEVEFMLIQQGGKLYVGCGSDHTDRKVEGYNVTVSKQMCEKPIARALWAFDDVKSHWERLILRSYVMEEGKRVLYQEGSVAVMRAPAELIALYRDGKSLTEGTAMFGGTLAAKGGIRPMSRFEFELEDPVRGLKLQHAYDISVLPVMG